MVANSRVAAVVGRRKVHLVRTMVLGRGCEDNLNIEKGGFSFSQHNFFGSYTHSWDGLGGLSARKAFS